MNTETVRYYARVLNYLLGFLIFGLLCVLMMPLSGLCLLLPRNIGQSIARAIVHQGFRFVRGWCELSGMVEMRWIDHRPNPGRLQLLIANHISMFDIVLLFGFIPNLQSLVNSKFAKNPLLYPTIQACGYISVKVNDTVSGVRAFEKLEESLQQGEPVAVFPEGTRSLTGSLGRLKKGAFRLASDERTDFVFFKSSQPFLNPRIFVPKLNQPVILEAHIFAGETLEGDWQKGFEKCYKEFFHDH